MLLLRKNIKKHFILLLSLITFFTSAEQWSTNQFDTQIVSEKPVLNRQNRSLSLYSAMRNNESFDISGRYRFVLTESNMPLLRAGEADGLTENGYPYFLVSGGKYITLSSKGESEKFLINFTLQRGEVSIKGFFEKMNMASSLETFKTEKPLLVAGQSKESINIPIEDNYGVEVPVVKGVLEIFLDENISNDSYQEIVEFIVNNRGEIQGFSDDLGILQTVFSDYTDLQLKNNIQALNGVKEVDYLYRTENLADFQGYSTDNWERFTSDDWIEHHSFGPVWDKWIELADKRNVNVAVIEQSKVKTFTGLEGRHTLFNTTISPDPDSRDHANNVTSVGFSSPVEGDSGTNINPFGAYWGGEVITASADNASAIAQVAIDLFRNHDVKVVNISQGIKGIGNFAFRQRTFRKKIKKAILEADKSDGLIVLAAGNQKVTHDHVYEVLEDSLDSWFWEKYLRAWESSVLNVGGVIRPGWQIFDTDGDGNYDKIKCSQRIPIEKEALAPNLQSAIGKVVNIYARSVTHRIDQTNYDWGCAYGTSFSAPLVAGASALLMSFSENIKGREVKEALINSLHPFTESHADVYFGFLNVEGAFNKLGLGNYNTFNYDQIWRAGTVTTSNNDDIVQVKGIILESTLDTMAGSDKIVIGDKLLRGNIYAGNGNNVLTVKHAHDSTIVSGSGNDTVTLGSATRLGLYTGEGEDTVVVNGQLYEGALSLEGGNDYLSINTTNFVRAYVDMGTGGDVVKFSGDFSQYLLKSQDPISGRYRFGDYNNTLAIDNVEAVVFGDGTVLGNQSLGKAYK